MTQPSSAALEAAREFLKNNCPDYWKSGVCAYKEFNNKGKAGERYTTSGACHAGLKYGEGAGVIVLLQKKDRRPSGKSDELKRREFIRWMCQEGPAASFVLNAEDVDDCCDKGILFNSLAADKKVTFWFAKTLRWTTEDPWRSVVWYDLKEAGVHPMMALVCASIYKQDWSKSPQTHACAMGGPKTLEDLNLALTCDWTKKQPTGGCNTYDIFWPCKCVGGYYGEQGDLIPYCGARQEKVSDGWGGYTYKTVADKREDHVAKLKELTKQALKVRKSGVKKIIETVTKRRKKVDA